MKVETDLTLCDGHTMQYTDDIPYNCTLETYIILLTIVTPINLIKKEKGVQFWNPNICVLILPQLDLRQLT